MKLRTSYALKEGGERDVRDLDDASARRRSASGDPLAAATAASRRSIVVPGTEESRPAELVLLAMGFVGPEPRCSTGSASSATRAGTSAAPATPRRWTACSPPATRGAVSR